MKFEPLSSQIFFFLSRPVEYIIPVTGFAGEKNRLYVASLFLALQTW